MRGCTDDNYQYQLWPSDTDFGNLDYNHLNWRHCNSDYDHKHLNNFYDDSICHLFDGANRFIN